MHYYYGICPSFGNSTYRYPTESFYRHMSGAIECVAHPPHTPRYDALVYRNISSQA